MTWINFFHFYQPANADDHTIRQATDKSYARIVRALEENPKTKFTLNISGCLLMRLKETGLEDLIIRLKKLYLQRQIELTGTAAYHPLLTLIPGKEIKWQIIEDERIKKEIFGKSYKPAGFFSPEMAYSVGIAKIIKTSGYDWIILDEICHSGTLGKIDTNEVYADIMSGLKVIFRNRQMSDGFPPDEIKKIGLKNYRIQVTATDAELYGLRHIDHTGEFEKILKQQDLKTELISNYMTQSKESVKIKLTAGTWSSTPAEIKKKNYYALWKDPRNTIHSKLWQLSDLVYGIVEKNTNDKNYLFARWHLVRGMASCTFWWASGKSAGAFSPLTWNPDQIETGINDLTRSVRSLENSKLKDMKLAIEKLSSEIKLLVWTEHWKKHIK